VFSACDGYDAFAPVYHRHWRRFSFFAPQVLDALALKDLPPGAHVLDLCCGTGQLARHLVERGFRVTGLDGSSAMLAYARQIAPSAAFIHADARDFTLETPADAVVSTSDSMNHIIDLDGLASAFSCVRRSLAPGGPFVFDLNTEEKYLRHWTGSFGIADEDQACIVEVEYDRASRIARFRATVFMRGKGWERKDIVIDERCHSELEVRDALSAAGFRDVAFLDWRRDLDPNGEPAKLFVVGRA